METAPRGSITESMPAMVAVDFSREVSAEIVHTLVGQPTARATAPWIKSTETSAARVD